MSMPERGGQVRHIANDLQFCVLGLVHQRGNHYALDTTKTQTVPEKRKDGRRIDNVDRLARLGVVVGVDQDDGLENVDGLRVEVLSERKALHIHDGHVARVVPVQLPRNLVTLLLNMLRVVVENEQDVLHTVLLQYGAEPKCANVDDRQRLGVSSRNELDPIQTICPVLNKPQLPRQDNCEL